MDLGIWILTGLIVAFVAYFATVQIRAVLPNLGAMPVEIEADVVELRRVETTGAGWEPAVRHIAVFRLADGDIRELEVGEGQLRRLAEGSHGRLRTRGTWFLGFTPSV